MRTKILTLFTALVLCMLALAPTASASISTTAEPEATAPAFPSSFCVRFWENSWYSGDSWAECGNYVGDANFTNNSSNLHNGCNRNAVIPSSSWNDCISSVSVGSLPTGYRVIFYHDASYGGSRIWCFDGDGGSQVAEFQWGANDAMSSYRVLTGNC